MLEHTSNSTLFLAHIRHTTAN